MSFALEINNDGNLERIGVGDTLNVDNIDVAGTGHLVIGASLGTGDELRLGVAGTPGDGDVRVLGDLRVDNNLYVSGSSTISVDETVTGDFAVEGNVDLGLGSGDNIRIGSTGGSNVFLGGGTDVVNLDSDLTLGDNLVDIGSSSTDFLKDLWVSTVAGGAGAGVSLKSTGNGTSGSLGVGVYTGGMTISPATDDLQAVLVALDAAISSGGGESLQQTYAIGNTIAVTTANGALQFSNTADVTNVLELSRTFAGAGSALTVSMGATTTGIGVDIDSVAGATGVLVDITNAGSGDALQVTNTGAGNALEVIDGSTPVVVVNGAGAVALTPTSGQNLTLTAVGAGTIPISAAGAITIDSTGAGISLDAAATSNFSTSAGNLNFDAAAGELGLDDVGSWGGTLSQTGDRTLDQTGAGEVLNGATSIIGAINRLANEMEDTGVEQFVSVDIPAGTTTTVGSPMAYSAVSGEVILADANAAGNPKKFAGIAREATAGPATITMWTPGARCTDAGASHTVASPLFISETAGDLTQTAPTAAGSLRQRVGWSLTATEFILDPGPPVIL